MEDFPKPIVADEIHIKSREKNVPKEDQGKSKPKPEEKGMTLEEIFLLAGKSIGGILIFILLLPLLYLLYLILRTTLARDSKSKADGIYREALYRFHMAGLERSGETPLQYAKSKADPALEVGFTEFMNVYLRLKYGNGSLKAGDDDTINRFAQSMRPAVRKKTGIIKMALCYFNILRASRYFMKPEEEPESENQTQSI